MRIGGLSTATGVPVATLKYYLREGLLHAGRATAVNQADYDESHVRRVRLVRSLLELGRLSIAEVADVLAAADDPEVPIHTAFGHAQDAMAPEVAEAHRDDPRFAVARTVVDRFVERNDLRLRPEARVRDMLAEALVLLAEFGLTRLDEPDPIGEAQFDAYAAFFRASAAGDLACVPDTDRIQQVEYTVVGTVAVEAAINAIRRMALEDASERRFGAG